MKFDEVNIEFIEQKFSFTSIIMTKSSITANLKGKSLQIDFQSKIEPHNHNKTYTFFALQNTFDAVHKNLLHSENNQNISFEDNIIAPMHGIIKIKKIKPNLDVKKGDILLILEAMKMEFSLVAPRDGVIEKIFINDGQQVSEKMTLLSLKIS